MQHKFAFFVIFLLLQILGFGVFFVFGLLNLSVFLSFEFGIWSFFLVVLASFLHYKRNIIARAKALKIETKPLMIFYKKIENLPKILNYKDYNDDLKPKFMEKMRNFGLFFSLLKLMAYGILVVGFLFLNHRDLLSILGYLSGISTLIVCVLIFALYVRYES